MEILEKIVLLLFRKLELGRKLYAGNSAVKKHLEQLHPGQNSEALLEEYFCKKAVRSLIVCLAGMLLGAAVHISAAMRNTLKEGYLPRGDYGEDVTRWELMAKISDKEGASHVTWGEKRFSVDVSPRALTDEECKELLADFLDGLPQWILQGSQEMAGKQNLSLDKVTEDLNLVDRYGEYPFVVEWRSDRPEVLASTGTVFGVEKAEPVTLRALITYDNRSWDESLDVVVVPKELSAEEQFGRGLETLLRESEQNDRKGDRWYLPESFQGQEITWQMERQSTAVLLIFGSFGAALLIFVMADKDLYDELLEKRKAHKARYPDLVAKLTLYLGAGLTVRSAFQRMAGEYEAEIGFVCRQLQAGISEATAYEQLGKRTGVQEYIRLSTLLTQNLKKGSGDLLKRLREETKRAENEKIQTCKKLAEEASTKLLVPMVLFLVVVMVMVMLPAFLSVEI